MRRHSTALSEGEMRTSEVLLTVRTPGIGATALSLSWQLLAKDHELD